MKLHLDGNDTALRVSAYDEVSVTVAERRITRDFALTPDALITELDVGPVRSLCWERLAALHEHDIEILILGTGSRQQFPGGGFYAELARARIGLEVMDSGAACRTYNILAAEGRRVAAVIVLDAQR